MFRKGDRVICIDDSYGNGLKNGKIYTVNRAYYDHCWMVYLEEFEWPFGASRFEYSRPVTDKNSPFNKWENNNA